MKKKYIFFDIDGTLTTGQRFSNEILEDTKQTVQKLKDAGHFVAVATGRPYFHAKMMADKAGIENIVCNGGYCSYIGDKKIMDKGMDVEQVKSLIQDCQNMNIPFAVSVEGDNHFVTEDEAFKKKIDALGFWGNIALDETIDFKALPKIARMIIDSEYEDEARKNKYDKIIVMGYSLPFLLVEPDDKFHGIELIMEEFNAPIEDVVVFGDGHNDVKMVIQAPLGIAMGNAVPELKEVADYITSSSDEGGISAACKHFGWID